MPGGVSVSVGFDLGKITEVKARLNPRQVKPAIAAAANKTMSKVRTAVDRQVRAELNLKRADVAPLVKVRRATYTTLSATLTVSRKAVPLSKYPVEQTPTGVLATPRKTQAGTVTPTERPYSFLAATQSGHTGVWVRSGPKVVPSKGAYADRVATRGPNKGKPILRQKLDQKYGPTVVGVLAGKPGEKEKLQRLAAEELPRQLDSQVNRFLNLRKVDAGE